MDARLFSEIIPTAVSSGQLWCKPSTGQVYIRLGSAWVPLIGGPTQTMPKRLHVLIDMVDYTDVIEKDTLTIEDVLTKEVDTCSFVIIDTGSIVKPQVGQEVLIFYRPSPGATPVLRFGGRITEVPQTRLGPDSYGYEITVTDYTQDLNKRQVVETYDAAWTAGTIIKDLIQVYAPTIGTYYVQDGPTIEFLAFNYKFVFDCIEDIAKLTGYDWYIDYEKNLHFFSSETYTAPYEISDVGSSGEYREFEIAINKDELKNVVVVRGGYEFSSLYSQVREADGTQTSFNLDYIPYAPVTVEVDSGGGYIAKTLGIDNIDTSGTDFVVNVAEKVIKNSDFGTLAIGDLIRVKYKYKKPVLAYVDDEASILLMRQYEGGDGVYEAPLIVDDKIETKIQARARGQAELLQYSNPLVEGSFITNQYGYRSGQILTVNINGLSNEYLIQQVTATSLGMGNFEYEVKFASTLKGLTEFLIQMYKNSRLEFTRTDQSLDRLKFISDEFIQVGDTNLIESRRDTVASPYKWSNDGGTTPGKGQYGLLSWG